MTVGAATTDRNLNAKNRAIWATGNYRAVASEPGRTARTRARASQRYPAR